jgi:hypothetical protein
MEQAQAQEPARAGEATQVLVPADWWRTPAVSEPATAPGTGRGVAQERQAPSGANPPHPEPEV